jgi:hypothetical protein
MFTTYQVAALLLEFVATIATVWGVMAKSQAALKSELQTAQAALKEEFQTAIAELKVAHQTSLAESQRQFLSTSESFGKIGLQINTILEGDVRELQTRVSRLESGQDEWTKTLRQRTHDLAGEVNALRLAVELLKAERK